MKSIKQASNGLANWLLADWPERTGSTARHGGAVLMTVAVLTSSVHAEDAAATKKAASNPSSFIACPVYRDTDAGRKSGCWLATDQASGVRYDVTDALIKPLLGREILVEGIVSSRDAGACGAPVLDPAFVSVLTTQCKSHLIPAENLPGKRFALPAKTLQPTWIERKAPPPPYQARVWTINFELDSDFLLYQYSEVILDEAITYIHAAQPKRIVITGYADTEGFDVSGRHIAEPVAIGKARARMIEEALTRMGVPKRSIVTQWKKDPRAQASTDNPLPQSSKRRATIALEL